MALSNISPAHSPDHIFSPQGLEDEIDFAKPADLGGLKSEAYLALNPEGKMPLLVTPEGEGIPESKVCISSNSSSLVSLLLLRCALKFDTVDLHYNRQRTAEGVGNPKICRSSYSCPLVTSLPPVTLLQSFAS